MVDVDRRYPNPPRSPAEAEVREIRARHADPRHAMQEIAERLGHRDLVLESTVSGARYFASCSCGYVSTTRKSQVDAVGAIVHHVESAVRDWHRSGLPLPKVPSEAQRPTHLMEKKHRHYAERRAAERAARANPDDTPRSVPRKVRRAV
jgi:hypothetical protein